MKAGAQGMRMKVGGRLNGAEIARSEGIVRERCLCIPCAPMSTMVLPKQILLQARLESRCGYTRARCFPNDLRLFAFKGGP